MDSSDRLKIHEYVRKLLADNGDQADFADSESLIESARLDSLAVTRLVAFLETTFDVDFGEIEFDPRRFDTVDGLAAMVEESRSQD